MLAPSVTEIVDLVRSQRARTFTCRSCGEQALILVTASALGRLPAQCETCEPKGTTWRRERAERPLRAAIVALSDRVAELEALIDADSDVSGRARRFGEPGRMALRRAVVLVAKAEGAKGTGEALLNLAAVALAWARVLLGPSAQTPDEVLQRQENAA